MPRRLAQQQMTLSDLGCLKSTSCASRAISAVAELLVVFTGNCRQRALSVIVESSFIVLHIRSAVFYRLLLRFDVSYL